MKMVYYERFFNESLSFYFSASYAFLYFAKYNYKEFKAKHMMNEQTMSNVKVELNIPGQKLMAQAMEVFDNYQPLVKEALEEAKEKLLFDKDFQQHIKDLVIQRVEDAMKKGVEQAAQTVINEAYCKHYREIEKTVHDAIVSKLTNK